MNARSAMSSAVLAVALVAASCLQVSSAGASSGTVLWAARTKVGQIGWAAAVGVSPDGARVYVTGSRQKAGKSFDYITLAYDAATGAELWSARYNGPLHNADLAEEIKVSPDGSRVFVTGRSRGAPRRRGFDYATVAYDAATGLSCGWPAMTGRPTDTTTPAPST